VGYGRRKRSRRGGMRNRSRRGGGRGGLGEKEEK